MASTVGGVPELVPHGEAGYLYPVGDVDGMSEGALEILSDPDLQMAFGETGRTVAVERFSAELVVPAYEACYEQAMESHPQTFESHG